MRQGCKQFFIKYESDQKICGEYTHSAGGASTIRSAKSVIRNVRSWDAEHNPRHFKVFDCFGDDGRGYAPCVYEEA